MSTSSLNHAPTKALVQRVDNPTQGKLSEGGHLLSTPAAQIQRDRWVPLREYRIGSNWNYAAKEVKKPSKRTELPSLPRRRLLLGGRTPSASLALWRQRHRAAEVLRDLTR